jgi:hypothetical protein
MSSRSTFHSTPDFGIDSNGSFQARGEYCSMTDIKAQSCRALHGRLTANLRSESGNYCRSTVQLTDAQTQGTKVESMVARDGKTKGILKIFY